ncbi:MAG: nuclear transport factor 2 family protein [Candidatus Dormibacteraeota bacterium]|uniref:Nuclear transport factor 2 family protein n=1 Tax=Candidatus Dormiibacter inghamiae TaxID=3127013 RepID=A0A934KHW4_9BACT|nr:nuclear transport factor 2 family protein [Candidatus Dormibacteraeota bacterium]MBJ7605008.1 nuclear transport factor 2 family protein [Candidatus Dormibacteraeota bacterium]
MQADQKTLVRDYIRAVGEGRLDEVAQYLREDVTFDGPGLTSSRGADAYLAALRRLEPIIARNEVKSILVDGDEACVLYDFVTDTPVGAVASAEWLRLEGDRIASVYLLFDKANWPTVLQALKDRASVPSA